MNKTQLVKQLNGIKEEYKKILKLEEFKQFKKDLKIIEEFTTKIEHNENETTKTQKIVINKNMLDNFKALANKICNAETLATIKNATNNQIKKAYAIAIFENTKNDLKLAIRTNTTKLYTYQDITKIYATFKATIENIKTQCKTMSICIDIKTNKIKFVDANAMYAKLLEEKQQERKNKALERKNNKVKQNENKPKIKK